MEEKEDYEYKLNHPFSIYLNEPLSAYTKYDIYYKELNKLMKYVIETKEEINNIKENEVYLTNIIIGTPMEDAIHKEMCTLIYDYQWQQLFPYHIKKFIKYYTKLKKDIKVNIIIISPDDVFMDDTYHEPLLVKHCEDYNFEKIENRKYIHKNENLTIKINIFTCPFPQLENTETINKYNFIIHNIITDFELKNLTPTETDKNFISKFYEHLEIIASNTNSNLIINSYATFRNVPKYDNYGLFKSLLKLANKYNIIATEWTLTENNIFTKIVSKINYGYDYINYGVCYIDPDYCCFELEKINVSEIKKSKELNICMIVKFPYNNLVYKNVIR
jgi:hypothetical protein